MRFQRVYIDPGSAAIGWAGVDACQLMTCGLLRPTPGGSIVDCMHQIPGATARIIIERPTIYPGPSQKGDQNDLVRIALMGGIAAGSARTRGGDTAVVSEIQPAAWKGQVAKKIMTERILENMTADELHTMKRDLTEHKVPAGLWHNTIDAIGLWLWDTERM